jgi:hypothetical protein
MEAASTKRSGITGVTKNARPGKHEQRNQHGNPRERHIQYYSLEQGPQPLARCHEFNPRRKSGARSTFGNAVKFQGAVLPGLGRDGG